MHGPLTSNATSDAHLARSGDRAAFGRLMDANLPMAYRLSLRLLGSSDESKDACQEAFVKAWEHLGDFDAARPFAAWLTTIVTRTCLDRLRRRQRSPLQWFGFGRDEVVEPPDVRADPHQTVEWGDLAEIVIGLLRRLPPTQRVVFALRDLEDLDVQDVADVTGISISSVKANLSYARRRIRTILAEEYLVKDVNA
jgi:RNA polymerase sigma-70 factor (ECF subfamily)